MSDVGDALTGGGSSTSGVTGASGNGFGDTPNLTDADFAGLTDADIMGGGGGGPTEFNTFSSIANALSGGAGGIGSSPQAAQTAAMTPPAVAAQTGGDPAGAAGGTQSNAQPGGSNAQPGGSNQQQQSQPQQQDHAPPSAVAELRALLKGMSGQPTGPTGPIQQASAIPTSPLAALIGSSPAAARLPPVVPGETGAQSPGAGAGFAGSQPGGAEDIPAQITAGGTPVGDTPLPPPRPKDLGQQQTAAAGGGGHDITVQPKAEPALPTRVPAPDAALPTHKGGAEPAPAAAAPQPGPSRLIQDITGASTGAPTALADLAKIALPLLLPLLMGGLGGGGRRGGFHGGRFTHGVGRGGFNGFRGGMNAMHYHGGRHPMAPGAWPYHHPQFGWHMHGRPPGGGWLPLNPLDAQSLVGGQGGQGGPDPNRPPKETGAAVGPPDQVGTSGAIPGVSAKEVDDFTRETAEKYHIDPDVASRVLAQESSYGQAKHPGDNGTSFGPFQLHFAPDGKAMGDSFYRDTGRDPRDPSTWKEQVDYALQHAANGGWAPWTTTMKKLGMNEWSGIGGHALAGRSPSRTQPSNMAPAAAIPTTLPVTSQPMVAGG
jgi:hypothetical protein